MYVDSETIFSQILLSCSGVKPQGWVGASGPLRWPRLLCVCVVSSQWWKGEDRRGASWTIRGEFSLGGLMQRVVKATPLLFPWIDPPCLLS